MSKKEDPCLLPTRFSLLPWPLVLFLYIAYHSPVPCSVFPPLYFCNGASYCYVITPSFPPSELCFRVYSCNSTGKSHVGWRFRSSLGLCLYLMVWSSKMEACHIQCIADSSISFTLIVNVSCW